MEIFAIRLKQLINENKITMYRLAKDINVNMQTVINWCNANNEPKLSQIVKICNYFDISSDYLLGLKKNDY